MEKLKCKTSKQYLKSTQPLVSAPFSLKTILTTQVEHSITGLDMRQESISQSLSLRSTFHQTSNIRDVQKRRYFTAKKGYKYRYNTKLSFQCILSRLELSFFVATCFSTSRVGIRKHLPLNHTNYGNHAPFCPLLP